MHIKHIFFDFLLYEPNAYQKLRVYITMRKAKDPGF